MPLGHEGEKANRFRRERTEKGRRGVEFDRRGRTVRSECGRRSRATDDGAIGTARAVMVGCRARVIARNLPRTARLVVTVFGVCPHDVVIVVPRRFQDAVGFRPDRDFGTRRPASAEAGRHQQQEGEHSGKLPAKHIGLPWKSKYQFTVQSVQKQPHSNHLRQQDGWPGGRLGRAGLSSVKYPAVTDRTFCPPPPSEFSSRVRRNRSSGRACCLSSAFCRCSRKLDILRRNHCIRPSPFITAAGHPRRW